MRFLILSVCSFLILGVAWAQTPSGSNNAPSIPFGQTFKDFQYPDYQNGELKATLSAVSAKGTTINRAETTELKIELYEAGKVTTTITSPKADLYLADKRMSTQNTVQIVRADMEATAQNCDFDLTTKKYLLRENVKVTLKNFDISPKPSSSVNSPAPPSRPSAPGDLTTPPPSPLSPIPSNSEHDSLLDSPGAYASTNSAPTSPSNTVKP
jgi:hypothetical protein